MLKPGNVSGIILAGGEGRRMGGQDKGWLTLEGQPMIRRVLDRLEPQVSGIMISANRNLAHYQQLGYPVIADHNPFQGPLGGIASCLHQLPTDYGLVVPVDAPWIPINLLQRLASGLPAQLILCHDGSRLQPLFGLYHRALAQSIDEFLARGDRKLTLWCQQQSPKIVTIGDTEAFTNLNTVDEWSEFGKKLPS
ncbi:MAG: molybdenum cofactor guanylyltransferase MobA [Pseudomonadota bacterium]|nr:molybdenum cofactor guanylyltransferase MobA [Pseudomonadota bacterium]